ncbi:GNAT family N-acetyltransferase [Glutamicibacter creatinolyticus]|uniref:GNAT family N-acetyltransferase n=1 Tax=Glutamicibacter creatinolyticus TaxID=162496 RepID=UPI001586B36E|nr:GNAT family N-acetyltransferase [Glutamicibacter creatinolyticus]
MYRLQSLDGPRSVRDEVVALYDAVGWGAYTDQPDILLQVLAASLHTVTAWDQTRLVGLARVVGDGQTICYLQDVLVHPDHQRRGLGRRLVLEVLRPYARVRQTVLLTDADPALASFYRALGFHRAAENPGAPLECFVSLR